MVTGQGSRARDWLARAGDPSTDCELSRTTCDVNLSETGMLSGGKLAAATGVHVTLTEAWASIGGSSAALAAASVAGSGGMMGAVSFRSTWVGSKEFDL